MKLIKTIIKIVVFLVILVILAAVVFLLIIMDTSTSDFTPDDNVTIEKVLGKSLEDSLANVATLTNDERKTDKNKIELSLTIDELNNFVVQVIRDNVNKDYLANSDNNSILEAGPAKLNTILFEEFNETNIAAKVRVEALGFYKTSLTLAGSPSIVDNNLVFQFNNFKFGNTINISKEQVISVKDFFKLDFGTIQGFDLNNMTYSFDLSSLMNSSNAFGEIVNGAGKNAYYKDKKLTLSFDTREIFTEVKPIQEPVASYSVPSLVDLAMGNLILDENQFNYLIAQQLNQTTNSARENGATGGSFTIGNSTFTYNLDKLYYNIDTEQMQAYIYINEVKANLVADVEMEKIYNGTHVESLDISVKTIKIGNTLVDASNFFSKINVPASNFTFGYDVIDVDDIIFNKENETCTIKFDTTLLP